MKKEFDKSFLNHMEKMAPELMEGATLTPGMARALGRNMRLKKVCDKCGFMMPKYSGRYPKYCPMCADPVTKADKEVAVDETEYDSDYTNPADHKGETHTHALNHKGKDHQGMHLPGPLGHSYMTEASIELDDFNPYEPELTKFGKKAKKVGLKMKVLDKGDGDEISPTVKVTGDYDALKKFVVDVYNMDERDFDRVVEEKKALKESKPKSRVFGKPKNIYSDGDFEFKRDDGAYYSFNKERRFGWSVTLYKNGQEIDHLEGYFDDREDAITAAEEHAFKQ
jgi:hypothetical protein